MNPSLNDANEYSSHSLENLTPQQCNTLFFSHFNGPLQECLNVEKGQYGFNTYLELIEPFKDLEEEPMNVPHKIADNPLSKKPEAE